MDADENAVCLGVGEGRARSQRREDIASPRFDHPEALVTKNRREPLRGIKRENFFRRAGKRSSATVVPAVSRVDDYGIKLSSPLPVGRCAAGQEKCKGDCADKRDARDGWNMTPNFFFPHTKSFDAPRGAKNLRKVRETGVKATN